MFRLNRLKLIKHPFLKNLDLYFHSGTEGLNELYTTVIIGENGTGKSNILKVISDIFRTVASIKDGIEQSSSIRYQFVVDYTIDNMTFRLKSKSIYDIYYYKLSDETKKQIPISDIVLPQRMLVSSMMLTDKFNAKSTSFYKYLGIRNENSPSSTGTRTYVRRTVDNIIDCLKRKNFKNELIPFFEALGLEATLKLSYRPRYRNVFYNSNVNISTLRSAFVEEWQEYFPKRRNPIWGHKRFESIQNDEVLLNKILSFLHRAENKTILEYDLLDFDASNLVEEFEVIKELSRLDIISYPELIITKKSSSYHFIDSSSGETHLVSEFIGLLSQIEDNSIILIDEPEISLHPNWQIKYIDLLKETFRMYENCHFIIATHSHFMLSTLRPNNSNVIALKWRDKSLVDSSDDISTYGWSPENILYRVFNVTTSRNYYFEMEVMELLEMISNKNDNKVRLQNILENLESVVLSETDPLVKVINDAKKYINEI